MRRTILFLLAVLLLAAAPIGQAAAFVPGDADGSGTVDILDLVVVIDHIVQGSPCPSPEGANAHATGGIDVQDVVAIINIILSGEAPGPVITTEIREETAAIPFTTQRRANADMLTTDTEKVVQQGQDGILTRTFTVTLTDGVETGRVKDRESVTRAMVPEIFEYGTKVPPVIMPTPTPVVSDPPTQTEPPTNQPLTATFTISHRTPLIGDTVTITWSGKGGVGNISGIVSVTKNGNPYKTVSEPTASGSMSFTIDGYATWHASVAAKDDIDMVGEVLLNEYLLEAAGNETYTYSDAGSYARSIYDAGSFLGEWNSTLANSAASQAMSAAKRNEMYHDGSDGWIESAAKISGTQSAALLAANLIAHNPQVGTKPFVGIGVAKVITTTGLVYHFVVVKSADTLP